MAKDRIISIRLSKDEYESVIETAKKKHMTLTGYARAQVLGKGFTDKRVSADTLTTMVTLYNCISMPREEWTEYHQKQFRKGVSKLHDVFSES